MTKFILIRYGEPDYSDVKEASLKGHGNDLAHLTKAGAEYIEKIGLLNKELFKGAQIMVASPITRALQTGMILNKQLNLPFEIDLNLREWEPDQTYQYQTSEFVKSSYGKFLENGGERAPSKIVSQSKTENNNISGVDSIDNGETFQYETLKHLRERILKVIDKYKDNYETVIFVCHACIIKSLIFDKTEKFNSKEINYGEAIVFEMDTSCLSTSGV
jgi:broad specificity phosphatase PhoE